MVAQQHASRRPRSRGKKARQTPRLDTHAGMNVSDAERLLSAVGGAGLTAYGLSRRGLGGLTLALLGGALLQRGLSGRCQVYSALDIDTATGTHRRHATPTDYFEHGVHVEEDITINRPPEELYRFWRNFENFPKFMHNIEFVRITDDTRSHWVVKGPAGSRVEWDAAIINDQENELIAWKTADNADISHTGSVRFVPAPGGRGTHVKVRVEYLPPAGKVGDAIAKLLGKDPEQEVRQDLRRFKKIMEAAGASSDGDPGRHARSKGGRSSKRGKHEQASNQGGATDVVQEASQESFPASDPPGWTSTSS